MNLQETPTEADCINLINDNLKNFYTISQRGDIPITVEMKKAALESFRKLKRSPLNLLNTLKQNPILLLCSEDWFVKTQLHGWKSIPARSEYPYGLTKEQLYKLTS
jgi:hypothetical protein